MKKLNTIILILLGMICTQLYAVQLNSIYPLKPNDSEAFYFTPENYPIKADGKMDVSDALQAAINQVKKEKNFGILFIPEGKYKNQQDHLYSYGYSFDWLWKESPGIYSG